MREDTAHLLTQPEDKSHCGEEEKWVLMMFVAH